MTQLKAYLLAPILLLAACEVVTDDAEDEDSYASAPQTDGPEMGLVSGRIYDDLAAHADERMADLQALGVHILRIEIERATSWSDYQAIVNAARNHGIEILALVTEATLPSGSPHPGDGDLTYFDQHFVPAYQAALDEVVTRLGVRYVEVWNEPDNYGFHPMYSWPPCAPHENSTRYGLLTVRVYETMIARREANQSTPTIVAFGISRHDDGCLRDSMANVQPITNHRFYFRPGHGLADGLPADIVAVHGYGSRPNPDSDRYAYGTGTFANAVDGFLAAHFADGRPLIGSAQVWYTEIGVGSADIGERAQADALHSMFATLRSRSRVTAAFWYDYRDDEPGSPEGATNGLRRNSTGGYGAKAAYGLYRGVAAGTSFQFGDVPPGDPFYSYVMCMWRRGAVDGEGDSTYHPYSSMTRDVFTKLVVKGLSLPIHTDDVQHFGDVPTSSEYYPFIETARSRGIISGYADGSFHPGDTIKRAQLAKMVVLAHGWGLVNPQTPNFTDVPQTGAPWPNNDTYPYQFVETARAHGVISGYDDRTFRPYNDVTNGQAAKMVAADAGCN
jgi:hypothetical protein